MTDQQIRILRNAGREFICGRLTRGLTLLALAMEWETMHAPDA